MTVSQTEMLEAYRLTPEEIVEEARREHSPIVKTFCLFSGGNDSGVLAHRCRDLYDSLCFIDTGTAIPGVREHVEKMAEWLDKPLVIYDAGIEFEAMVLGAVADPSRPNLKPSGFPGPGGHSIAYNRLKLRQIEALVRDHKTHRGDRIGLLTGVRYDESARRKRNVRQMGRRNGAQVWINPIASFTTEEMNNYRRENAIPESDVAALIHRSGECNCGSYAAPGEREMLESLWPEWFENKIARLEDQAKEMGLKHCQWGAGREVMGDAPGPMCSDCQLRIEVSA
jgi:3'-phosphoadenosine 5'-phosphosulfate sulfotransferase (PAPS reductase)/FAD synthetase